MLQEAEEAEAESKEAENDQSAAPAKRKAKTKFGNKKKKKKTKTTSKFPGGDEDGYEVNTVKFFVFYISIVYCIWFERVLFKTAFFFLIDKLYQCRYYYCRLYLACYGVTLSVSVFFFRKKLFWILKKVAFFIECIQNVISFKNIHKIRKNTNKTTFFNTTKTLLENYNSASYCYSLTR